MQPEEEDKRLTSLLAAFDLAYERTENAVTSDRDRDRALRRATAVSEHVRGLVEKMGQLRTQAVARIYDEEKLSLAGLADRIGVSRPRAAQLMKAARDNDSKERDDA